MPDETTTSETEAATTEETTTTAATTEPEGVTVPKAEWDAMQSSMAEMRRERKKAEEAVRKAAEDKARADGEHEKLATQALAERDAIKAELAQERATAKVRAAAGRMKFRNPEDAVALLPATVDREDDAAVDRALKQLADERKYLVDDGTPARTGSPAGGGTPPPDNATLDEQLAEAAAKGDWDKHRELNKQKLAQLTAPS